MNKKYAIVSIVLIALMSLSLIPMSAFAFHTPSSTDDHNYDQFGPRPSQLLITIYTDYAAELAGFKNKEFDVMDWGLDPADYLWFEANDPNHAQYSTAFYAEFGLYEYDTQDQVLPTSIVSFRQAISYMIDKDYFIGVNLPNAAAKADSPIASITGWYNPALTDLYNLQPRTTMTPLPDDPADWAAAYALLVQDMGPPEPDPESPGYFTWTWPTPFPTPDPAGLVGPVPNGHLLVFARSDSNPARLAQGQYLKDCCETALPAMTVALGLVGGLGAKIHVDLYNVGRPVTSVTVMKEYWFHYYSGGWSLSRDPDFLQYYQTNQITKPLPNAHNYPCYSNPNYDAEVDAMMGSAAIGSDSNPSDGKYHAYVAQQIFMSEAGIIPMWTYAGYKAYLSNWRGVVNQIGFGVNSWWTFLNAHKVGSEGSDVIKYGWQGDLVSLNTVGATWLWDYEVLNKIYDSLIAVNPYNMANDISYIANSWEIGTWTGPDGTATMLTFHLREDVAWQDIPYLDRSAITFDNGHEIDGPFQNYYLTPIDIAFSFEYQRDNPGANAAYLMDNLDHVELNLNFWGDMWPYTATVPEWWNTGHPEDWQMNFIQTNTAIDPDTIVVKLSTFMPWLGLHRIGGVPIIPMHIWSKIPMIGSEVLDAWGNDIVYGTGPYILLSRNPGVSMTLIPFVSGASYRGITTTNSYFYQPVRPISAEEPSDTFAINGLCIYMAQNVTNYYSQAVSVTYKFDYDLWYWNATQSKWVPTTVKGVSSSWTTTIGAGKSVRLASQTPVATIPATKYKWCDWFIVHESFHMTYTLFGATWTVKYLDGYSGSPTYAPCRNYWSDDADGGFEKVHFHPGDIAGKAPAPAAGSYWDWSYENTLAADGKCDIKDVSIIGAHWGHKLPEKGGNPHPGGTYDFGVNDASGWCRRADINGDGVVDIKDVSIIGANWGKSWSSSSAPRDPIAGEAPTVGVDP